MSPGRADMMIEARTAFGVKYTNLVNNCNDMSTEIDITTFDAKVSLPELKFTAVRENEPVKISLFHFATSFFLSLTINRKR